MYNETIYFLQISKNFYKLFLIYLFINRTFLKHYIVIVLKSVIYFYAEDIKRKL